jgi:hypothetical protein
MRNKTNGGMPAASKARNQKEKKRENKVKMPPIVNGNPTERERSMGDKGW